MSAVLDKVVGPHMVRVLWPDGECDDVGRQRRLVGTLRCVERCCPRTRHARRSDTLNFAMTCSTQARRRAGQVSFPKLPLSESASQASDPTRPCEAARSPAPAPSVASLDPTSARRTRLSPAVIVKRRHLNCPDRFRHRPALRHQHVNLPELGNDLLRLVAPNRQKRFAPHYGVVRSCCGMPGVAGAGRNRWRSAAMPRLNGPVARQLVLSVTARSSASALRWASTARSSRF